MNYKKIFSIALIAFLGGIAATGMNKLFFDKNENFTLSSGNNSSTPVYRVSNSGILEDFTAAAESTVNAVVHVKTMYGNKNSASVYDFIFGNPYGYQSPQAEASGSGVILSEDGFIVTNNHVIENANSIEVVLNDNRTYPAKLIGRDPSSDIALLKIEENNLPTIPFGDSEALKVGEWVLAVGNPFNLTSTVTAGIVSAKARNLNMTNKQFAIESFIQTDAAVNPGNSGGALVNTNGELIGINTAIASKTGSYSGYSFAVPSTIVKKIVADLKEFGTVQRALLGVSITDMNSVIAKELDIEKLEGVYVNNANEGGAAAEAGIEAKDIILSINDKVVNKVSELQEQISKYRPGDKIKVTVKRDNKIKNIEVTLRNSLGTTSFVNKEVIEILGASFSEITKDEKQSLNISHGLKVSEIGAGKLLNAGIQEGFIIMYMNRAPVTDFETLQNILNHTKGGVYLEGVYPDGTTGYYAFGLK